MIERTLTGNRRPRPAPARRLRVATARAGRRRGTAGSSRLSALPWTLVLLALSFALAAAGHLGR